MSYLVLARKYRPRTFAEVAGQELITGTLQGAIREGRVGHAYLFTGPRGTGKTTSARIFAKALQCERGPLPDPCGVCEHCLAIDAGGDVDVVEIDAASNTGVENIRDLREHAAYTPMRARFKIFIIDEVHMLSKGAFNALLKTLEEPPPHVKFLFATTELNKVPDTILSRCQLLRLSLFSESEIAERLTDILQREDVHPETGVAEGVARLARGSMRDALSLADQLLALAGNAPRSEDVARLAGASASANVALLLEALLAHDGARALELLGPAEGGELDWIQGLLRDLRGALLIAVCKEDSALTSDFAADRERLARVATSLGAARLQLWMEDLLHARERMEEAPSLARTVLELALLELCRDEQSVPLAQLVQRLAALEQRLGAAPPAASRPAPSTSAAPASAAPAPAAPASSAPAKVPPAAASTAAPAKLAPGGAAATTAQAAAATPAPANAAPAAATGASTSASPSSAPASRAARPQVLRPLPPPAPYSTGAPAPGSGEKDAFTRSVKELFGGRIEEKP